MLYLIRGLPGSGKSTLAKQMLEEIPDGVHLEADMYFVKDGEYVFEREKLKEAHQWCQDSARLALSQGKTVIVSNTFVKRWEMESYLKMTDNVSIITTKGNYANIHSVGNDVLERMRANWEEV